MPVSVPTSCSSVSVPDIVASGSFLDQSTYFAPETIFTPAAAGLFRISIYGVIRSGSFSSYPAPTVGYTDAGGSEGIGLPNIEPSAPVSYVGVFASEASQPIQLGVAAYTGTGQYDLYYTLEQLQ